ncbi:hypothetical protein GWI33_014908 [Rhynchophorus ferrugineus]|uniref:Uncharacterized protein n=1 Tax=Rhynchophorus ferrugineus TaxID=354439 RepID=A0A834IEB0_RHYFE|nr:hypothetical protein GWI33_014908 [Rhynchophorus ferrugineus]
MHLSQKENPLEPLQFEIVERNRVVVINRYFPFSRCSRCFSQLRYPSSPHVTPENLQRFRHRADRFPAPPSNFYARRQQERSRLTIVSPPNFSRMKNVPRISGTASCFGCKVP